MQVNCRNLCKTCNQYLFGVWSEWSTCAGARCLSDSPAVGRASRQRICYDTEGDRSNNCEGEDLQYKKCEVSCAAEKSEELEKPEAGEHLDKLDHTKKGEQDAPCFDNLPTANCQRLLNNGQCRNPAINSRCQKTCMACVKSGITDKTVVRAPDADKCFDKDERCETWEKKRCVGLFGVFMRENCAKRCGFCQVTEKPENNQNEEPTFQAPEAPKTCKDAEKNICDLYSSKCQEASVQKYCPVTCSLCVPPPETVEQQIEQYKKLEKANPDASCSDKLGVLTCKRYKDNCSNFNVANICKRTCGKCPEAISPIVSSESVKVVSC